MESKDEEKNPERLREKDILRRHEILDRATKATRQKIVSSANISQSEAAKLGVAFAAYDFERIQIDRQAQVYMERMPSDINSLDTEINKLEGILGDCDEGNFTRLMDYIHTAVDEIQFTDPDLSKGLMKIVQRMPARGIKVKRPRPSYLDEEFNGLEG